MAGGTERTSEGTESLRRVEERLTGTEATTSVRERLQGKERRSRPPLTHPLSVAGQVASKLRLGFCTFIYVFWFLLLYFCTKFLHLNFCT